MPDAITGHAREGIAMSITFWMGAMALYIGGDPINVRDTLNITFTGTMSRNYALYHCFGFTAAIDSCCVAPVSMITDC